MLKIGQTILILSFALSPLAILLFRPRKMPGSALSNVARMFTTYYFHYFLFVLIYFEKNYVDSLNDPIRGVFGDFTWLIHAIEGNLVLVVQQAVGELLAFVGGNHLFNTVLSLHYLFLYLFINYFSVIFFSYVDDRDLANKAALNYFVTYLLSVPFYIFFNVQVTSDYLPEMKALLYNSSFAFLDFFSRADPLDNAFPSLHIGITFGLLLLMWWRMRADGDTPRTWAYGRYYNFVLANLLVFTFSILYLGVHWIIDIPAGMLIGFLGAAITEEIHRDFDWFAYHAGDRVVARLRRRPFLGAAPIGRAP